MSGRAEDRRYRERESGVEYGGGRVVVQNEVGGGERVIDGGWGKQG